MLCCTKDILLLAVIPHLARESRAANVASTARPARSLDVAKVLPVTVAIVVTSKISVHDIVIYRTLKDLGCLCDCEKGSLEQEMLHFVKD